MIQEKKLFSAALEADGKKLFSSLLRGSVSEADCRKRVGEYEQVFGNYESLKRVAKTFSAYTDNDILANQYFDATVAGLANSFAGYVTIERYMDQPKGLIYFLDLIGALDNRVVLPNIGAEGNNLAGFSNRAISASAVVAAPGTPEQVLMGKTLVPGTVVVTFKKAGTADIVAMDNKLGVLNAAPGVLTAGTVNYTTGQVDFDQAFAAAGWSYTVSAVENQTASANINRFKTETHEYFIDTYPELLVGESNLVSIAAMQKSLGVNPEDVIVGKLQELYTKMINAEIVREVKSGDLGNPITIDVTVATTGYQDFRSRLDHFVGSLADVDQAMARKSVKGVNATSYLCGLTVGAFFKKTKALGLFTNAESSYVNDLIGFFDGAIPVLQHVDITDNEAYAIHKTKDGNLAPVARGIYLPLTNTPAIGNYANPTQVATGVFYQQATKSIAPELQQKFILLS